MKMVAQLEVSPNYSQRELLAAFGPSLVFDEVLAPFSSFKTGGPAKYFISAAKPETIIEAIQTAQRLKIPYFVLGGGSNLLVSDDGFDGLVVKVDVFGIRLLSDTEIECGAGENLMDLINFAAEHGLTGLEFASGIWGSVGGAIYGNAGAYGGEIKDVLTEVTLVDTKGTLKAVPPEYCRFAYRDSILKVTKEVVVSAKMKLAKGNRDEIRSKIDEIISVRAAKHPPGMTAGSFFKNIPDANEPYGKLAAGKLLEAVDAKGLRVGGAVVYEKHANIIVNTGNATSKDIRRLADIMKQRVYNKFGIMLEEEVIHVGNF